MMLIEAEFTAEDLTRPVLPKAATIVQSHVIYGFGRLDSSELSQPFAVKAHKPQQYLVNCLRLI